MPEVFVGAALPAHPGLVVREVFRCSVVPVELEGLDVDVVVRQPEGGLVLLELPVFPGFHWCVVVRSVLEGDSVKREEVRSQELLQAVYLEMAPDRV